MFTDYTCKLFEKHLQAAASGMTGLENFIEDGGWRTLFWKWNSLNAHVIVVMCDWSLSIPPEKIRKSLTYDVFRGYRKRPVGWNWLKRFKNCCSVAKNFWFNKDRLKQTCLWYKIEYNNISRCHFFKVLSYGWIEIEKTSWKVKNWSQIKKILTISAEGRVSINT